MLKYSKEMLELNVFHEEINNKSLRKTQNRQLLFNNYTVKNSFEEIAGEIAHRD